jgi:hypothetical protein
MTTRKNIFGAVLIYLGVNFFVVNLLYVFYGIRPTTPVGWLALCTLGLPIWAGGEWLSDSIHQKIVKKYPSPENRFSLKRIAVATAILTIITITAFALAVHFLV